MSWAFIEALSTFPPLLPSLAVNLFHHSQSLTLIFTAKYPQQSYNQLLNSTRDELRGRYDQKPQLSCSHELDCNLLFII